MDLFRLSKQNSNSLEKRYNLLMDRCRVESNYDVFRDFVEKLKDWRISINMRPSVLNNVLISGKYKSIYKVKKEDEERLVQLGESPIPCKEAVRRHLGRHAEPREIFDQSFENGENLTYAAFNIGGIGLTGFGPICAVIKRDEAEKYSSLAFIKEDSERYIESDHVDMDRLKQDVADREHVCMLAVLKHEDEIARASPEKWASMTCCTRGRHDHVYIEAVTKDEILNTHIEVVRMSEDYFRAHYLRYFIDHYESGISEDDEYRLFLFRGIFILMEKLRIECKVISAIGA